DADHLLIPDLAGLYPLGESNGSYSYIGPLLWSPDTPQPSWWQDPDNEPMGTVYVTLGSSGDPSLLPQILDALANLPVRVIASTAGAP
uniref:glycosyltransferase n=1 Tax=Stenotrophomonas maltophilia TaxID=40324 RepID=UPI0034E06EEC